MALVQDPCNAGALVQDPYRITKATLEPSEFLRSRDVAVTVREWERKRKRQNASRKTQAPTALSERFCVNRRHIYAQLSLQCPQLRSGSCNVAPKRLSLQLLSLAAIAHEFGMYRRKIEETCWHRAWSSGPALEILRHLQELELDHEAGLKADRRPSPGFAWPCARGPTAHFWQDPSCTR